MSINDIRTVLTTSLVIVALAAIPLAVLKLFAGTAPVCAGHASFDHDGFHCDPETP